MYMTHNMNTRGPVAMAPEWAPLEVFNDFDDLENQNSLSFKSDKYNPPKTPVPVHPNQTGPFTMQVWADRNSEKENIDPLTGFHSRREYALRSTPGSVSRNQENATAAETYAPTSTACEDYTPAKASVRVMRTPGRQVFKDITQTVVGPDTPQGTPSDGRGGDGFGGSKLKSKYVGTLGEDQTARRILGTVGSSGAYAFYSGNSRKGTQQKSKNSVRSMR